MASHYCLMSTCYSIVSITLLTIFTFNFFHYYYFYSCFYLFIVYIFQFFLFWKSKVCVFSVFIYFHSIHFLVWPLQHLAFLESWSLSFLSILVKIQKSLSYILFSALTWIWNEDTSVLYLNIIYPYILSWPCLYQSLPSASFVLTTIVDICYGFNKTLQYFDIGWVRIRNRQLEQDYSLSVCAVMPSPSVVRINDKKNT